MYSKQEKKIIIKYIKLYLLNLIKLNYCFLKKEFSNGDQPSPVKISTPSGDLECYVELGVIELELER